ncbi:MAG: hypothetical protein NT114_00690 [Patescibacteria group bacterium]|nr:hypothetical protein [Patescibacteria group bacterium]
MSTTMLTYYQVTRPRKVKVRVVKAHSQVPFLGSENVIDTRPLATKGKSRFGSSFFLSPNEKQITEYEAWQKLSKRLKKRII